MENPNEYDDEAYTNASISLQGEPVLNHHVSALWSAGATRDDIINEFTSAVEDAIDDLEKE